MLKKEVKQVIRELKRGEIRVKPVYGKQYWRGAGIVRFDLSNGWFLGAYESQGDLLYIDYISNPEGESWEYSDLNARDLHGDLFKILKELVDEEDWGPWSD